MYATTNTERSILSPVPLTDDQIRAHAPSVFAEGAHGERSSSYSFVSTDAVLQGLRGEGFLPYSVKQAACRVGDRNFTKHMLRFRHRDVNANAKDQEFNELLLTNSHDGSSTFELMMGRFRVACLNGLVVGASTPSARVSIAHKGSSVIHNVIEGASQLLDRFGDIDEAYERFRRTILLSDEVNAFAEGAINIRYPEGAPILPNQLTAPRRTEDKANDLWTVFNRVQENMMRGGIRGISQTGRRTMTRPVTGLNSEIDLNRNLWDYAEQVQRMVAHA